MTRPAGFSLATEKTLRRKRLLSRHDIGPHFAMCIMRSIIGYHHRTKVRDQIYIRRSCKKSPEGWARGGGVVKLGFMHDIEEFFNVNCSEKGGITINKVLYYLWVLPTTEGTRHKKILISYKI